MSRTCLVTLAAFLLLPGAGALAQAPPGTDLWSVSLREDVSGLEVGEPMRLTDREGYDNQPHFLPGGTAFLYTSIDGAGQADIRRYDLRDDRSGAVTRTAPESEYSPTPLPGGGGFSTVRVEADSTQRLWRFDMDGQPGSPILEGVEPVGYHAWADEETLVLYVLGEPSTLQIADVTTGEARIVARNVGRTILPIPGTRAVSYLHYRNGGEGWITELEVGTRAMRPVIRTFESNEFYTWTPNGTLLTAEGSTLYRYRPGDEDWVEVADLSDRIPGAISRMAVSPQGDRLVLVAAR